MHTPLCRFTGQNYYFFTLPRNHSNDSMVVMIMAVNSAQQNRRAMENKIIPQLPLHNTVFQSDPACVVGLDGHLACSLKGRAFCKPTGQI